MDLRLEQPPITCHDILDIIVICEQLLIFLHGELISHQQMQLLLVSLQVDIFVGHILPVAYLDGKCLIRVCKVLGDRVLRVVQSSVDLVALEHVVDLQEVV